MEIISLLNSSIKNCWTIVLQQGMRSKPFSVKQKKIQLQEKRARKRDSLSVQEDGKANLDHDESRDLIKKDKLKSNNGR